MNNKKLAIGALIVVLLSGLMMYLMKESDSETQAQQTITETAPVAEVAAQAAPTEPVAQPVEPVAQPEPVREEPKSLGASSSGLGR